MEALLRESKISPVVTQPMFTLESDSSTSSSSPESSRGSSCSDSDSMNGNQSEVVVPTVGSDLKCKNSVQLTDLFIHHLHSMYTILEHFTKAADYITEQYLESIEA